MDQRTKFVEAYRSRTWKMTELCDRFGVSRKTGYKWLRRAEAEGWVGLGDRSRRPHSCPWQTPREVEQAIVEARVTHPDWGPVKILEYLEKRQPDLSLPAPSTAGKLLDQWDLVKRRRPRRFWRHPSGPVLQPLAPNELMTADFKGQFRTGDGVYCYPLTIADSYSRYLLRCQALSSVSTAEARPVFERLFRETGLPQAIQTDNGAPFSATGLHGLCGLSVWWMRLGIQHLRSRPGHPQDNGRHERMHRTLKAATARPPASNHRAQQRRFDAFRAEYNEVRPHQALGGETPASLWRASSRPYPARMPSPQYPGHFETRLVSNAGCFRFKKQVVFLSQALKQEWIGLEEVEDGIWSLHFYDVLLARLDEREMTLYT
jgi:transposase InsO family protein